MSTGLGLFPKLLALGTGATLSVVGWNALSDEPVSVSDAVVQISAMIVEDHGLSAEMNTAERSVQTDDRISFESVIEAVSTVGAGLIDSAEPDEKPAPVVVNRGVTNSRNAGGAKFVSTP